jgi:hypothetical protein
MIGWLMTSALPMGQAPGAASPADLVLLHATIRTANRVHPRAQAMAVHDGHIVGVGTDREIEKRIGPATVVWDLRGLTVLPGLIDSHGHLSGLGERLANVDLVGTRSYDEVIARVVERCRKTPAGQWVKGRGWDQNDWPVEAMPHHEPLSRAVPDHPVALDRVDGHAMLVNRRALELARITKDSPDPPGGLIERDSTGAPTGVLIDNAADLVEQAWASPSAEERQQRLREAMRACAQVGLTMVGDAGIGRETRAAYRALVERNELPIRVYAMAYAGDPLAEELLERGPENGDRFVLRAVKVVYDGALGSRGALLSEPYSDRPGHIGLERWTVDSLAKVARRARDRGLQMRVHAIGDLANTRTLDAFERAFEGQPHAELRWAIEHAQVVKPEDVLRFARLGVIASMQATHATSDGPWAEERLGPRRIRWGYAWRQFLEAGARFANGSDFPVESEDPKLGLYASITRRDLDGKLPAGGWYAEERLSPDEALLSFTLWGAYAAFRERDLGSLEPGKLADFVVLDRDPFAGSPDEILKARVLKTVVGGQVVYEVP